MQRIEAFQAHLSTRFSSEGAAINAAMDIDPSGETQPVWLDRSCATFNRTLILHGVQIWKLNDSPFYCFAPADHAGNMKARATLTSPPAPVTEADKLAELLEQEGYDTAEEFAEAALFSGTVTGICMAAECDYTTEVEPDQDEGYCEACDTQTVMSGLTLALSQI
jgi:hypothetical protein